MTENFKKILAIDGPSLFLVADPHLRKVNVCMYICMYVELA